jgi:ATP-dependent DNA helicase RecQ
VKEWDATTAAKKALSAVYRTSQRFGVAYLTDVLVGEETPRIIQFGHRELPTFGVGKELSRPEWASVFRQLVSHGFLSVDVTGHGGLSLTAESKKILTGGDILFLRKDIAVAKKGKRKAADEIQNGHKISAEAEGLFQALKNKRLELAKARKIPPYVIFHDKTLQEMAARKPHSLEEMAQISGVGEHKLRQYGPTFLEILNDNR